MATAVQLRRGTTTQNNAFTGALGEVSVDTTLDTIRVHDGSTQGGFEITSNAAAQTLTNKSLTAPTITGTAVMATLDISGDVDVDGTLETDALTIGGVTLAETISDTVGAMVGSNTETGITVTYEDGDNTLDFALGAAQTTITSLLATDIKIGEDDQTKIDFETADEIHFYAANARQIKLVDGALVPVTDNDIDLGTSSLEFKDAFFDGTVTADAFAGPLTGNVTGNASGSALTVTQAAQSAITSLGTLTALTVDDVAVDGKVITMTGSSGDTFVTTVAANGATSLVTTDTAAAAAHLTITADGTVDINSAGVLTLDGGAAINIEPAAGSAILLDGTISIDAGVVTGATSITSTAFVGGLTGNVTGNASGTALTVTQAAQSAITSLGTLTTLTVDNVIINGSTIGHTGDTDLITVASGIVTVAGEVSLTTLDIGGTNVTTTAAEINLIDGGTARGTTAVATGDGILINDGGTMRMTNVDTVSTYFSSHNVGGGNIVTTGALNSGTITSGFGNIDTGSSTITTTGAVATGALTAGGILKTDDATDATSTTDGSLQTDGGLSVAKDVIAGNDVKLLSDGAIITMGANSDINLTHVHDTGITTNGELTSTVIRARKPVKTEFNASGAVTASLTAAESGATVLIHGTENNVINLPAAATTNPGLYYDFVVLTAVGGGTSTIVNIAGSGGQFVGALSLAGGTAANAVLDNAGDAFTFIASTVVGSRARITCLTDDGTDGVWQVESLASPIATID